MARYLFRRLATAMLLVMVATTLAFFIASVTMHRRDNYKARNPPVPESSVDAKLNDVNQNDKTPIVQRYVTWVSGLAHGDFGKTWKGESRFAAASTELDPAKAITIANATDKLLWDEVHSLTRYRRPDIKATKNALVNYGALGLASAKFQDIGFAKNGGRRRSAVVQSRSR